MNWYKAAKLNLKIAQSDREYWIDQDGDLIEADGDEEVRYNHEARAIEEAQSIVKRKLYDHPLFSDLVSVIFGEEGDYDSYDPIGAREYMNNWIDSAYSMGELTEDQVNDIYGTITKETGVDEELLDIAMGNGVDGAARDYAIKNWKWIALRGRNLEMPDLSRRTLSRAIKGVYQAFGDKTETLHFNITERMSNNYYPNVPFYELERGPTAIRNFRSM
jgi:hypothetical protein